jgi:hypothetical protein
MNIVKPRPRLEVRMNFFSVRTADDWNSVPGNIKLSRTSGQFKSCTAMGLDGLLKAPTKVSQVSKKLTIKSTLDFNATT